MPGNMRTTEKAKIYFLFIFLISACAPQQYVQRPTASLPELGLARIVLEREFNFIGSARLMDIVDNGKPIGEVAVNGSLLWDRPPGTMNLSVKPLTSSIFVNEPLNVNVMPGYLYRIKATVRSEGMISRAVLMLVNADKISGDSYYSKTIPPPSEIAETPKSEDETPPANVFKESVQAGYGRYYALVIGNNGYKYLTKLRTSRSDAQEIAGVLRNNYGFDVELLLDASRSDILLSLSRLRERLTKKDNLLIYYAGHGWLDKQGDEGYWLPVDASQDNEVNWVSNADITTNLKAMEAKHVLFVADSCYSGKLGRGVHIQKRSPDYYARLSVKRARSVISSGGLEPVIDSGGKGNHSVFATAFLEALKENTQIADATELFERIRKPVMLNSDQTPEYADIRKADHDGGEFIFVRVK